MARPDVHPATTTSNLQQSYMPPRSWSVDYLVERRRRAASELSRQLLECALRACVRDVLHRPVNTSIAPSTVSPASPESLGPASTAPSIRFFPFQVSRPPERQDHDRAARQNRAIPLQRQNDAWFMRQQHNGNFTAASNDCQTTTWSTLHLHVSPTCRERESETWRARQECSCDGGRCDWVGKQSGYGNALAHSSPASRGRG